MRSVENMLRKEAERLKEIPVGSLKVANKERKIDCYYKEAGMSKWRYLKTSERGIACALAQRDYDIQLVKVAEERIRVIERFLDKYAETDLRKIYRNTNPGRRLLLSEGVVSDEVYVKRWLEFSYEGLGFEGEENEIITERGERVRSKSEKIIADKLYALGIPYRYECPLVLRNHIVVHPDFTILCVSTRQEVYLEHFGMMNDEIYVDKTMNKLATYERNGIYLGVNLFMTFETGKRVLNTRALDDMLRKLFCEEE